MKLAIIQKWDETLGFHGYLSRIQNVYSEENINNIKYLNYFKKKKFVVYSWDKHDDDTSYEEFIVLFHHLNNIRMRVPVRRANNPIIKKYKLQIIKEYNYSLRDFCSTNYSFEYFIKKCKKYYSQKLAYYKSPKSLLYRKIYGKYNFKLNNV